MKRALFFSLFACLISTLALSQGFQPAVTYPSGADDAHSMAVADVNGDGKPDLLVANYGGGNGNDGSVAVLLGNGDGTFQPPVSYDAGGWQTFSVVAADLKGDGKLDLVVTNSQSNTLGVLLGNGDGTFQPAVTYHTLYFPMNAVVADVNGDGIPDLVVDSGPGYLSVLLGKGNGTFKKARQLKGGGYWVTAADLTGNGRQDLIVADGYGVNVLLNEGNGKFKKGKGIGVGPGSAGYVAVADVNGDGKPDLLAVFSNCVGGSSTDCAEGSIGVLLGNGDGTFQSMVSYGTGAYAAESVAVADVNGDGKPDLVVANFCGPTSCPLPGSGTVTVLLGNDDGTFQTPSAYSAGGYWGAFSVGVADVNGDGWPDLLINNFEGYEDGASSVGVLLSNY